MNRKYSYIFALLLLCFSLFGCEHQSIKNLRWVDKANPISDAHYAIEKHDNRFIAVTLEGIELPGIPVAQWEEIRKKYGIKIIEGTSDVIINTEHSRLIEAAILYAEQYNKELYASIK